MPLAVIDCVNVLGRAERSMLVFTDRHHGHAIGDYTPTVNEAGVEDESVVMTCILPSRQPLQGYQQECPRLKKAVLKKSQEWICLMLLL
jgi:hypothetical protein